MSDELVKITRQGHLTLSPTQIETFMDCERKWAFRIISGIEQEQSPYAAIGDAVHLQIEEYLLYAKPPNISAFVDMADPKTGGTKRFYPGKMALSAVKYLPPPQDPGILVEEPFELESRAGIITGRLDLQYTDPTDGLRVVHDNKTSGDFRWAKKATDLDSDIQSVVYNAYVMQRYEVDRVKDRWLYILRSTQKTSAKVVERTVGLSTVDKHLQPILDTGERMQELYAKQPDPHSLTPNLKSCEKYGGCPYKEHCNLKPQERLKSIMSQMSLRDKVKARMTGAIAAPAPAAKAAAPRAVAAPKPAAPSAGTAAAMRAKIAAAKGINPPEAELEDEEAEVEEPAPAPTPKPAPRAAAPKPKAAPAPKAPPPPPAPEPEAASAAALESFILLVDCAPAKIPAGSELVSLEDVVQPLAAEVAAEHGVAHYRLISTEFGVAQSHLMAKVGPFLEEGSVSPGTMLYANTASLAVRDTLELFEYHAALVVRKA